MGGYSPVTTNTEGSTMRNDLRRLVLSTLLTALATGGGCTTTPGKGEATGADVISPADAVGGEVGTGDAVGANDAGYGGADLGAPPTADATGSDDVGDGGGAGVDAELPDADATTPHGDVWVGWDGGAETTGGAADSATSDAGSPSDDVGLGDGWVGVSDGQTTDAGADGGAGPDAVASDGWAADGGAGPDAVASDGWATDGGAGPDAVASDGWATDGGAGPDAGVEQPDASSELDSGLDATAPDVGPPCVPIPETCNGLDDDCDDLVDNVADLGTDCSQKHPGAAFVQQWACVAGGCQVASCVAGHGNCDGSPATGCGQNLATDPAHCGTCPNDCLKSTGVAACSSGVCDPGCTTLCDGVTGTCTPRPLCSPQAPCTGLANETITTAIDIPVCHTTDGSHPFFDDGAPLLYNDPVSGEQRAACYYVPKGAGPTSRRPLVVFVHGALGSAAGVYNGTSLRAKAPSFDLSGDPARPGFVLVADQGRNLHAPDETADGERHDIYYRDLGSPSTNPDIRSLDALVDLAVETGFADPKRIYLVGWSNGAFFSQLYGIARHTTPTPGGNRVAAVIAFAGGDPFENVKWGLTPSCKLTPYPKSTLPIGLVHRACESLVACNEAQLQKFSLDPGFDVETWVGVLGSVVGDPNVVDLILDSNGKMALKCTLPALCTGAGGLANHLHWPDGIADGGGNDWEPAMLDFLKSHPLGP